MKLKVTDDGLAVIVVVPELDGLTVIGMDSVARPLPVAGVTVSVPLIALLMFCG